MPKALCLIIVLFLSLAGCSGEDVRTPASLAIEGWIDSDGYPVVVLTRALSPSTDAVGVDEALVRWGRVTISDGERTEVMTGGMDPAIFPPYSYKCFKMKGEVGRRYTVHASYDGMELTATSELLPPARIDTVTFQHEDDSLRSARLTFTPPADTDTCRFVVFTRVRGKESRHYMSLLGAVTTHGNGAVTIPVFRGKHRDSAEDYQPNFQLGDTLDLLLARVDEDVYRFWDAYQNAVYFGGNIFLSTEESLPGNTRGGYGIFSARGVARRILIVSL